MKTKPHLEKNQGGVALFGYGQNGYMQNGYMQNGYMHFGYDQFGDSQNEYMQK